MLTDHVHNDLEPVDVQDHQRAQKSQIKHLRSEVVDGHQQESDANTPQDPQRIDYNARDPENNGKDLKHPVPKAFVLLRAE